MATVHCLRAEKLKKFWKPLLRKIVTKYQLLSAPSLTPQENLPQANPLALFHFRQDEGSDIWNDSLSAPILNDSPPLNKTTIYEKLAKICDLQKLNFL